MRARVYGAATAAWALIGSANAATFTYDAIGRLQTYTADNGITVRYCYDLSGNRTQVSGSATCPTLAARSTTLAARSNQTQGVATPTTAPPTPSPPPTPPETPTGFALPAGLPDVFYTARDAVRPNE
jgi:YD repeat-containing protein